MSGLNDFLVSVIALTSTLVLLVIAVNTLFELLDFYGFNVWFGYSKNKKKRDESRVSGILREFLDKERDLLVMSDEERINILLNQLGLKHDQLLRLRRKILELRMEPMNSFNTIKYNLEQIIALDGVIVDQSHESDKVYTEVNYYINFADIMFYENHISIKLAKMLAYLVRSEIGCDCFDACDVVVAIPVDGNFLLGKYLSEILKCSFVKIRAEPRLRRQQYWDGMLLTSKKIIIVNDVLVTSNQIEKTIHLLQNVANDIAGAFFLVSRVDSKGEEKLSGEVKVSSVLRLNESEVKGIYERRAAV